jgi:hypothetical protein
MTQQTQLLVLDYQPDLVWIKGRDSAYNHQLVDVIRGVNKPIRSNLTTAEATLSDSFNSFDSDGFTLGGDGDTDNFNNSGQNYVAWNWLANGSGASNTDGSITSTVSANTTSGFSIVKWTGTGSNATVGHGLGKEVKFFITKRTDSSGDNWYAYHSSLGGTKYLHPNNTSAAGTAISPFNNTNPTSTTISAGTDLSGSSSTHIAYCFSEVKGFSKFGSYTGNGNADGTFVYTGFAPAFVMIKMTSGSDSWFMYDNKRSPFNVRGKYLVADGSGTDSNANAFDFVSNGFKIRTTASSFNGSGSSYIYMAFAENPLVGTNGVPATAR